MQHVYRCEKCGAEFEEYSACYDCENGHVSDFSSELEPEIAKRLTYSEKCPVPDEMILTEHRTHYHEETQKAEHEYVLWTYKLVGKTPKREVNAIMAEYEEREKKYREWLANNAI